MNRLLFRQKLNHLREDALRFQNTLCAYETTDAVRYPENFEKLGLDMARQAESIACSTRNIVSIFQMNGREQVQSCAAEAQGITVKEQSYGYEVILPHLMPKRNHRNHTVFLLEPLTYAVKGGPAEIAFRGGVGGPGGIRCGCDGLGFGSKWGV